MTGKATVTIPADHYRFLSDAAAEAEGVITGRTYDEHDILHPGDPLGTILCEAWRVDPWRASTVMVAYMSGLHQECDRRGITPPPFARVLKGLPMALNTTRYPDVDATAMTRQLFNDVPEMYGQSI
jgi:hypothetical protein